MFFFTILNWIESKFSIPFVPFIAWKSENEKNAKVLKLPLLFGRTELWGYKNYLFWFKLKQFYHELCSFFALETSPLGSNSLESSNSMESCRYPIYMKDNKNSWNCWVLQSTAMMQVTMESGFVDSQSALCVLDHIPCSSVFEN